MRYLAIILLFCSCGTYKAYQKVQEDAFVDDREKKIILDKALLLHPDLRGTPTVKGVDSAEYNATINAYIDVIAQLIANDTAQDDDDFLFIPENGVSVPVRVVYRTNRKDSLRIISNFLKVFKVPAVVKTIEVPTVDGRKEEQWRIAMTACNAENAKLLNDNAALKEKISKRSARTGWFLGGGLLLAVIMFLVGRFIRR